MPPLVKPKNISDRTSRSPQRIAKVISRAGICSRRETERWIIDGRVKIDGQVLQSPATTVTDINKILIDEKPLPQQLPTRLWRYYKRAGLLTTNKDPQGRPTIFETLPRNLPRLISVGRLDLNDGNLARKLELPSNRWRRRYRVRVRGIVDTKVLDHLKKGIIVDGIKYGSITAVLDRQKNSNAWITLSLMEGKNREVRKIMEYLAWPVNRLIRIGYGPFQLGNMIKGSIVEVNQKVLHKQFGS